MRAGALRSAIGLAVNAATFFGGGNPRAEINTGACSGLYASEAILSQAAATVCAAAWSSCAGVDDLHVVTPGYWRESVRRVEARCARGLVIAVEIGVISSWVLLVLIAVALRVARHLGAFELIVIADTSCVLAAGSLGFCCLRTGIAGMSWGRDVVWVMGVMNRTRNRRDVRGARLADCQWMGR